MPEFSEPLSRRYRNNGKSATALSDVQREARDAVVRKIAEREYLLESIPCPACGNEIRYKLTERDAYAIPVSVVMCSRCNFLYTSPRMEGKSLGAFYNTEYRRIERGVPIAREDFFQLQHMKGNRIHDFLAAHGVHIDRDSLIAEVGCGAGGILQAFAEKGYQVIGCDLGMEYVEYGKREHGLDLYTGGIDLLTERIHAKQKHVGLLIYEQTFEHLMDIPGELTAISRLADDQTVVYIGVPGIRNLDEHYDSDFLRHLQPGHTSHFDLSSLSYWLERASFERLVGDEIVRAAFRKSPYTIAPRSTVGEDLRPFLSGVEERFQRKRLRRLPKTVYYACRRAVGSVLRKLGLRKPRPRTDGA